jgi:2-polyprenyl-6-methoxyphenol hydroxylase-like FAD-dependent oxidoreductase
MFRPDLESPFRVIIVGGGPTGLAAAHCLHAAGIDYVVLERRPKIVQPYGAALGLWPQGVRLLHQLHLVEAARKISSPMHLSYHMNPQGKELRKSPLFDVFQERFVFSCSMLRGPEALSRH